MGKDRRELLVNSAFDDWMAEAPFRHCAIFLLLALAAVAIVLP